MRAGWNNNSIVVPEVGHRLENIGVKAITLHPRTTKQRYTGKANWIYIKELKSFLVAPQMLYHLGVNEPCVHKIP